MSDWQPIETAPMDDTEMLGYDGSKIKIIHFGWMDENDEPLFVDHQEYMPYEATHWMPLPEAPNA